MEKVENLDWKESLFKSIIYRIITVFLGFTTAYIITGDVAIAIGVAILTEAVQFANYFIFEIFWTNFITKKRIIENYKQTVDLTLHSDAILELAYRISNTDTFIGEVYLSSLDFLKSILKNENLKEIHSEVEQYLEHFKFTHRNREFGTYKVS
ncbi:MAG: DUF2061 domain-containing protein [Promethearchaeota archaeon]